MRREFPLAVCFIMGVVMIIQFFVPHGASQWLFENVQKWLIIIAIFALSLGLLNLVKIHAEKVAQRRRDWAYSIVTLGGVAASIVTGFWGIGPNTPFMKLYDYIQIPMQATMFSLLAFYIASASFRTFRARTLEATLLLVAAVIVMLGRVPLEQFLGTGLTRLTEWILDVPNMAAKRGIMIGVGLGAVSMALKIILGIERSWLGGGDKS